MLGSIYELAADAPGGHHTPKLFHVWGHSYELADNDNWDIIERLAETVGGREDVWYATNIEICSSIPPRCSAQDWRGVG